MESSLWRTFPFDRENIIPNQKFPAPIFTPDGQILWAEGKTIMKASLFGDSVPLFLEKATVVVEKMSFPHGSKRLLWSGEVANHLGLKRFSWGEILTNGAYVSGDVLTQETAEGCSLFTVRHVGETYRIDHHHLNYSESRSFSRAVIATHTESIKLLTLLDGSPVYSTSSSWDGNRSNFHWRKQMVPHRGWRDHLVNAKGQLLFRVTVREHFEMLFSLDMENPTVVAVSSDGTARVLPNTLICEGRLHRVEGHRISHHDNKTAFSLPDPVTHLHGVRSSDEHRVVMAEVVGDRPGSRELILGAQKGEGSFVTWEHLLSTRDAQLVTMRIVDDILVLQAKRNPHVFLTARQATWGNSNPLQETTVPNWIQNPTVIPDLDGIPAIYGVRVEDDRLEIHRFEIP